MKGFLVRLALLGLGACPAHAENAATAAELGTLGGRVVERGGVPVEFSVDVSTFTAADYGLLGRGVTLRKLSLDGNTLTDATLLRLSGLAALEELSTNRSALSDDGYRHFAAFSRLRSLALWHPSWGATNFTGAGLAHLHALPRLEKLTFAGSTAGDAALEAVGRLAQLREFSTWHTAQTQLGNAHLARLPGLIRLKIGQRLPRHGQDSQPSLDASTLPVLARLPRLETLELFEIRLRAADLAPLAGHAALKRLVLHTTDLPAEQADAARAVLPGITLDFSPSSREQIEDTLVRKLRL